MTISCGSSLFVCGASLYHLSSKEQRRYSNLKWQNIESNPKALVTSGPYSISRHPVYLSYVIMTASFGFLSLHKIYPAIYPYSKYVALPILIPTSVVYAFYLSVACYEETKLKQRFGPIYHDYTQSVNRWIGCRTKQPSDVES